MLRALFLFTVISTFCGHLVADAAADYQTHCAVCHEADRLGGTGPALLPECLEHLRKPEALKTIAKGCAATQPTLTEAQIRTSRTENPQARGFANAPLPIFKGVDMMNLFIVVETGDHHVTVLDGDKLEPIHRFQSRFALHGSPKFTPDGRYVFFASRDGWITKFDIWNLSVVAEIRAGVNTRNVAVSGDGKTLAVANYLPHNLVLLDSNLNVLKILEAKDIAGKQSSRVSAVYDALPRQSFIVALKDVPEVWEISYNPQAEPIPAGLVHDYQYKEGAFIPGYLNARRTVLAEPLDDLFFTQDYSTVMGTSHTASKGQVVNLNVRQRIADLNLPGMPHLGSGITWQWQDKTVMASTNLKDGLITVIDMSNWKTVKTISTAGPGFFMRSHEKTPYAWTDAMMSADKDTLHVIDKRTLQTTATVKTDPGKTLAHIEFTKDGKYALASLWERKADGGALIVLDAATFKEVKRIPMDKPVGKYNLHNILTPAVLPGCTSQAMGRPSKVCTKDNMN